MNRPESSDELDDAAELTRFLASRDVQCPGCGYNLRGLTTSICPECRDGIELRIGMAEPKLGPFLVALSGLLGGSGMGVLFHLMIVYAKIHHGWSSGPTWREVGGPMVVTGLGIMLSTTLAVLLARRPGRAWFRRRTRRGRFSIAAWACVFPFVVFLLAVWAGDGF